MRKPLSVLTISCVLAACGGGTGGVAATVNGVEITVAEVQSMRTTEAATVDKATFASDLTDAIIDRAAVNAAKAEFSIEPTEAEIDAKVQELTTQIEGSQDLSVEEFFASQNLPIDRLRIIANQQAVRDKLYDHFEPEVVPATEADPTLLLSSDIVARTNACVRHILVATEQDAVDAKARVDGGEEFAAVATEIGTDATAPEGGDLGCQPLNAYVPAFAEAAATAQIGVVTEPVQSDFGWHLILVESRKDGRVNQLIDAWLIEVVADATVTVASQYGTWVTEPSPMVQAPTS